MILGILGLIINIFILFNKEERKENIDIVKGYLTKIKGKVSE
jgi:hypothetical protein